MRLRLLAALPLLIGSCGMQTAPLMSDMTAQEQQTVQALQTLTGREYRDNGYLNEAAQHYDAPARGDVSPWLRGRLAALAAPIEASELRAWTLTAQTPQEAARQCVSSGCAASLALPTLTVRQSGQLYLIGGGRLKNLSREGDPQ